jgi:serine/threonine-protein kinase
VSVDNRPERPDELRRSRQESQRHISHYEILNKLGEGAMGVVYCARDLRLDRLVALKILPAEQMTDSQRRGRFIREAKAASALNHPNIVTIYEIDSADDVGYIAMEYVQGTTLAEMIPAGGLSITDAINYASQIAAGLATAHAAGIVHRDIKPANVIVTKSGMVKLLDFGLAQIEQVSIDDATSTVTQAAMYRTTPGTILGTVAYMSPEQAHGKATDNRSDVFSFGIVLYQMLTGSLPFRADSLVGMMYEIAHTPAPSASQIRRDLPPPFDRVLSKALEKEAKLRYQSMDDLLADLQEVGREVQSGTSLKPPSAVRARELAWKRYCKKPAWIAALATALILVPAVLLLKVAPGLFDRVPTEKKIAVLAFRSIGDNKENEPFRDGLMESLTSDLTELSQFHGTLWVVPSSEVRRGVFTSAKDAQRALGVNLVVTGSVQRDASHVHLRANLVDANSLRQLRSREITRPVGEIADLQAAVVQEVAGMLELELNPRERQVLAAGATSTSSAYDCYLQARGHLQRRLKGDVDRAVELFKQAIQLDPKYALAYAGLGESFWRKYRDSRDVQWVEPARKNCKLALGLNDRLAPVYVTLGIIEEGAGRHDDAIKAFHRALELDPISAEANTELAAVYEAMGRLNEVEATFKKAARLRPGDWSSASLLGAFYFRRGRYDEAVPLFREVIELAPDNASSYTNLGAVYWMKGEYADAASNFERSLKLRPTPIAYTNLGTIYFFMDRCAEAVPLMEKATAMQPKNELFWGNLGDAYACVLQDRAKAVTAYEQAIQLARERLSVNANDGDTLGRLALYQARLGDKTESVANIRKARLLAPTSREVVWHAALVYGLAGDHEAALEALRSALKSGQAVEEVRREPALATLRNDPRYERLMADVPGHGHVK